MDLLWEPPGLEEDLDTTFIVAGDIWLEGKFAHRKYKTGETWLHRLSSRFKYVVIVLGNHDYWGANVLYEADKLKKHISEQPELKNIFLLENDVVVLDQVKFVGSTLWTDFNKHDPMVLYAANNYMNDYRYIRYGRDYRKVRPLDIYEIHANSKRFLFQNVKRESPDQKVVVVTHMAPSIKSVSAYYNQGRFDDVNFLYYSDLEKRIEADGQDIDYWFHGHMHHSDRYKLCNAEVILNPRGYGTENSRFDPSMRIEI